MHTILNLSATEHTSIISIILLNYYDGLVNALRDNDIPEEYTPENLIK